MTNPRLPQAVTHQRTPAPAVRDERAPRSLLRARLAGASMLGALAVLLIACAGTPAGTPRGGEVQLRFVLPRDLPVQVSVHRLAAGRAGAAAGEGSFAEGQAPTLGPEIVGGDLHVEFDVPQRVLLVLRNPLDRPVRFWAAPHLPSPHHAEPALIIRCLCTGDTHEVPARGTWTRVIEVGIRRRDAVERLMVTHVITEGDAPSTDAR